MAATQRLHHVEDVIAELQRRASAHQSGNEAQYYDVRDRRFNPKRQRLAARSRKSDRYPSDLAAMFIYLNRIGFNGLYRLNARGDFNVPIGRYANPQICDASNLRAVSSALRSADVTLRCATVDTAVAECVEGDFVYFDPPYAPLTSTSSFTSYTAKGFADLDQRALQQVAIALVRRGCSVVMSNSTAPIITRRWAWSASFKVEEAAPKKKCLPHSRYFGVADPGCGRFWRRRLFSEYARVFPLHRKSRRAR